MRNVTVAATQMACSWDLDKNIQNAERLVREAHSKGAQVILIQELFAAPYFCIDQSPEHYALAQEVANSPLIKHFSALAKELEVVLPLSLFEKCNNAYYNSLVMIDADGSVLDTYRKTHIPNGPAYQEKQFFIPGDTGFKVWNTRYAKIGVGICWDQWFPETARVLALQGAEIIFYPTAIGSEPAYPDIDSQPHWTRVQQGHAAANVIPVIASNRIGTETSKYIEGLEMTFYGSSFIADQTGALVEQANKTDEAVLVHTFDLDAIAAQRAAWGLFRDRRPNMYSAIATSDGSVRS
ncbi:MULTISPECIES: N-carbamoylputrescine amidase [Enterobacteriaceae]|uniref:N-carbamoylputrescine amidase n=1 Tax=Enterobacteriaceae TaxID=543 RepID=UPI00034ED4B3|nr:MULTISPECIES: N-carbamoylputrescine amidase [Enterobacteriaceae]AGN86190.1 N-carbamoylputrescine amidase [Enterobacter sp. R4-368]MCL6743041.1 N-carbamoylputrescine amidase [Kosakonia sp. R1.Fl]MCZ3384136.1 N-carbamoylputrescine amidase [Kosakonia sp. SOY2]MDZ7323940.1 N-carbamoylputrescine amidase [Kosakonia sacchari]PDO87140.1 N-carbamoylputrescine amidase [Kosakonia sacchari]